LKLVQSRTIKESGLTIDFERDDGLIVNHDNNIIIFLTRANRGNKHITIGSITTTLVEISVFRLEQIRTVPLFCNATTEMIVTTVSPSFEAAQKWAAMDLNPTTAKHTLDLVAEASVSVSSSASETDGIPSSAALASLESLFPHDEQQRIGFGTAGLRSEMKPGPLGMNDLTVCQAAQGLASYCVKKQQQQRNHPLGKHSKRLCAVVGYDHRSHPTLNISSLSFAILTAIVFAEAGIDCLLLHNFVMTPLVPFAVKNLGAVCGVMVTASHNPKQDNGYKVYDSDACQIRSPTDKAIASEIKRNLQPWKDYRSILEERKKQHPNDPCLGLSNPITTEELLGNYFASLENSCLHTRQAARCCSSAASHEATPAGKTSPPSFAYTPMHGVGHPFAKRAFEVFGIAPFEVVPEQRDPDPSFPTGRSSFCFAIFWFWLWFWNFCSVVVSNLDVKHE
jgi:hypothetical protein